ncbi:MAG: hypothetical protein AAF203_08775 [Pseudomonadota bacterium]
MKGLFILLSILSIQAFGAPTKWTVEVPISQATLDEAQKEIIAANYYEDGGVSCGGDVIEPMTLSAYNPPNWLSFNPVVHKVATFTADAYYKFEITVSTPASYCGSVANVTCEVTFNSFDTDGKLKANKYNYWCEEPY